MSGPNVFDRDFLRRLTEEQDEPPSLREAEGSGEWRVVSFDADRHLLFRSWEDAAKDEPTAIFQERPAALLCAAVLPLEARPRLFVLQPDPRQAGYLVLARDSYDAEAESASRPIGEVRAFNDTQALALHLAACFTRSPHALALLLEAAGPTAIRMAAEILARRLAAGA